MLLAGCGTAALPGKPDLPASVSPGWTIKSYESSAAPEGLPAAGEQPVCWKALYKGAADGMAEVWVCGYRMGAFEPMQRARPAANTVKFYKGSYLVEVRYSGGTKTDFLALMRALEKSLG